MTRAREGGGAKAFFRRPRHQRLPATEQGGKERNGGGKQVEQEHKEGERGCPQRSMRRKPVDRGGTKKESQEAKRRNETGQTPAMSKRQWSENEPSVVGQESTRGERTFPSWDDALAAGEGRKMGVVLSPRGRPRGLQHSVRRPWRRKRCRRRSPLLHRRGRVRRGAHVARCRCRAPHERATKCAFRRR